MPAPVLYSIIRIRRHGGRASIRTLDWQGTAMHMHNPVADGRGILVRSGLVLLALASVLVLAGCSPADPSDTIVLQVQQKVPDRLPVAATVRVDLFNDSAYQASVQVDYYIGDILVHHSEALLASISGSDINTDLSLGWDEADRVVVSAQIADTSGTQIWSVQNTYTLGTDFNEGESLQYTVAYPPSSTNQAPVAMAASVTSTTSGNPVTLSGTASYDPDGDPLTYQWEQISGIPVSLVGAAHDIAMFTAPSVSVSDTLVFRLTVSDGRLSAARQVNIVILSGGVVFASMPPGRG